MIVVGTLFGRLLFYNSKGLTYHTQILVKNNNQKLGKKINGVLPMPITPTHQFDRILVTSSDSRIRIYNLTDFSLHKKLKGIYIYKFIYIYGC